MSRFELNNYCFEREDYMFSVINLRSYLCIPRRFMVISEQFFSIIDCKLSNARYIHVHCSLLLKTIHIECTCNNYF